MLENMRPTLAKKSFVLAFLLTVCSVMMLLTACGQQSKPTNTARMSELGNEFVEDLSTVIVEKSKDLSQLQQLEAVIVTDDSTYNINYLLDFYEQYKVAGDTQVTSVFSTKTFVVTRVVFEDGGGYYFRYERDPKNENEIKVTSQALDEISLKEDDQLNRVELTLSKKKSTPIIFTFKNLVVDDAIEE